MAQLKAAQIRIMGDADAVQALTQALVDAGYMAVTGSAPNRRDAGLRIYGVGVLPSKQDA